MKQVPRTSAMLAIYITQMRFLLELNFFQLVCASLQKSWSQFREMFVREALAGKKIIAFPAAVGLRPANDTHLLFYPQLLIPHTCRWSRWFVWSGNSDLYSQEALFSSYRVCPRQ